MEERFSSMQRRIGAMELHEQELRSTLLEKADTKVLEGQEASFAARVQALEEQQQSRLASAMAGKASVSAVEEQRGQLSAVQSRLVPVEHHLQQCSAALSAKLDAAQFDQAQAQTKLAIDLLESQGGRFAREFATKADRDALDSELRELVGGAQARLAAQAGKMERKLAHLSQLLADDPSSINLRTMEDTLQALQARLAAFEEQHSSQHRQLADALAKASGDSAVALQQQGDRLCGLLATKKDVAAQLERQQERLGAHMLEAREQFAQVAKHLKAKVDATAFKQACDEVSAAKEEIKFQRDQLAVAVEKKDQIIAMSERMQEDLRIALALKGRGPRREPLSSPLYRPSTPTDRPASKFRSGHGGVFALETDRSPSKMRAGVAPLEAVRAKSPRMMM